MSQPQTALLRHREELMEENAIQQLAHEGLRACEGEEDAL